MRAPREQAWWAIARAVVQPQHTLQPTPRRRYRYPMHVAECVVEASSAASAAAAFSSSSSSSCSSAGSRITLYGGPHVRSRLVALSELHRGVGTHEDNDNSHPCKYHDSDEQQHVPNGEGKNMCDSRASHSLVRQDDDWVENVNYHRRYSDAATCHGHSMEYSHREGYNSDSNNNSICAWMRMSEDDHGSIVHTHRAAGCGQCYDRGDVHDAGAAGLSSVTVLLPEAGQEPWVCMTSGCHVYVTRIHTQYDVVTRQSGVPSVRRVRRTVEHGIGGYGDACSTMGLSASVRAPHVNDGATQCMSENGVGRAVWNRRDERDEGMYDAVGQVMEDEDEDYVESGYLVEKPLPALRHALTCSTLVESVTHLPPLTQSDAMEGVAVCAAGSALMLLRMSASN